MFKVNLEKELLRQNKKIATPQELLLIKEYDKLGADVVDSPSMKSVFGEHAAARGASVKTKMTGLLRQTAKFDQQRVFHTSQIESLCKKYYLRFLPSHCFNGSIDPLLPSKINQFELAYNVKCNGGGGYNGNTFIAAPKESFALEQRPKDPLLFYRINNEYFYLIHKWGNDLSILRRAKAILSTATAFNLLFITPIFLSGVWLIAKYPETSERNGDEYLELGLLGILIALFGAAWLFINLLSELKIRFFKKNDWQSRYTD